MPSTRPTHVIETPMPARIATTRDQGHIPGAGLAAGDARHARESEHREQQRFDDEGDEKDDAKAW